jgi:ferric-dicitrate binding protein FerR (iron transport regulator)
MPNGLSLLPAAFSSINKLLSLLPLLDFTIVLILIPLLMGIEEALQLAKKIASGNYNPGELNRLLQFIDSADLDQIGQILDAYQNSLTERDSDKLYVHPDFIERLRALRPTAKETVSEIPVAERETKTVWLRWAAAAAVLLISLGSYFYLINKNEKPNTLVQNQPPTDVRAPQTNRATITLAGGRKVFLDSAANGTLASQGTVQVLKLADGQVAYSGKTTEITYNTLTNPRGSKPISMTLADGSKVWLNAGSSLTYPITFAGKERNVEMTGEAYFEVTHNAAMPFIVNKLHDDAKIKVLGTHFNVNAYDDEGALKVTLMEGSVKVSKGTSNSLLKPGQQAQVKDEDIKQINNVDTQEVMAWKNGKFQFGDASDIGSMMRQISRWYDVDVEYKGNITGHVGGSISRNVNASQVLKMLETTGAMKFKIEGRKVTVMPTSP